MADFANMPSIAILPLLIEEWLMQAGIFGLLKATNLWHAAKLVFSKLLYMAGNN